MIGQKITIKLLILNRRMLTWENGGWDLIRIGLY